MPKDEKELWTAKVMRGLELTYERLIEYKKLKNSPLIVSEGDKIVEVSPYDLPPTIKKDLH